MNASLPNGGNPRYVYIDLAFGGEKIAKPTDYSSIARQEEGGLFMLTPIYK